MAGSLPHRIDILTLFPALFDGFLSQSIVRRAIAKGLVAIERWDIRSWAEGKPFGQPLPFADTGTFRITGSPSYRGLEMDSSVAVLGQHVTSSWKQRR